MAADLSRHHVYSGRRGTDNVRVSCLPFVCAAIGEIVVYVDGMNGLMRCSEVIQWLYSLMGSKVGVQWCYCRHSCRAQHTSTLSCKTKICNK